VDIVACDVFLLLFFEADELVHQFLLHILNGALFVPNSLGKGLESVFRLFLVDSLLDHVNNGSRHLGVRRSVGLIVIQPRRRSRRLVISPNAGLYQRQKNNFVHSVRLRAGLGLMRLKSREEQVYPRQQPVVDFALELKRRYAVLALGAVPVDLGLLRADEGFLVDVWVDFDV
jgi:hypothetical protein